MKSAVFCFLFLSSLLGCKKEDAASAEAENKSVCSEVGTPACIQQKILSYDENAACDDASVKEYVFQGNTVFNFEPGTCGADMMAEVYDCECNLLGTLGGITGNTKINDEAFSNAVFVQVVWENKESITLIIISSFSTPSRG